MLRGYRDNLHVRLCGTELVLFQWEWEKRERKKGKKGNRTTLGKQRIRINQKTESELQSPLIRKSDHITETDKG